jgi:signal transduction histidine kinase
MVIERFWLPIGLTLIFLEWVALSPMKPFPEWDLPVLIMKLMYFAYAMGCYYFINRLGVHSLNLLWGIFSMGLAFVVLSEISALIISDIFIMGTVSSVGVLVITLGIYYAEKEWKQKNRSLVTEIKTRKKTEDELKKRGTELEEALKKSASLEEVNRLKSQFLSTTSHELRTPITPIMMQIQMLLEGRLGKMSEKQKKSMEMVLRDTKRLDRLISDILDLSRLQISSMKFIFESNDLNQLVKNTVESMKYVAQDKRIELTHTGKKIKPFVFDKDRVTQVLTDLINNAIKFTPEGGKVEVSATREGKDVVVKVKDNGIGMSKPGMKKLFKPFSQIDEGVTRKYGGAGLGLSICKGIIEHHKGKIWAESGGLGKGSTFIFTLPFFINSKRKKG